MNEPAHRTDRSDERGTSSVTLLIPTFNDWTALAKLFVQLDRQFAHSDVRARLVIVDDGSTDAWDFDESTARYGHISSIHVLVLRRNLGHQRAIAVGLTYLYAETDADTVVVMDGDGEDRPEDVPVLLDRLRTNDRPAVVFAERSRRSEKLSFRFFYSFYLLLHRILLGRAMRIGNFSALPRSILSRLTVLPEMWNHYPAAVVRSRVPFVTVPTVRGKRLDGRSSMNFIDLVIHGLSAIAVSGEVVWVRALTAASLLIVLSIGAAAAAVFVELFTDYDVPGWASMVVGVSIMLCIQVLAFGFVLSVVVLNHRMQFGFIPLRDYRYFVDSVRQAWTADERV